MVLPLAYYGNPVLRAKGAEVEAVTPEIELLIKDMLDTMKEYRGIGLAAQQIGQAIQLTVLDIRAAEDRPSTLALDDAEADPHSIMPIALLNPKVTPLNNPVTGPEGCLSFPEIFGDVTRPEKVRVEAMDGNGERVEFVCGGLLAKCVQHETDHLHGILFIDRMDRVTKRGIRDELEALQEQTKEEFEA